MTDLYEELELDRDATFAQIKAAYRKQVKKHHPDKGGDAEKFGRVQLAFEVLGDPRRKARYDRTGRTDEVKVTPEAIQSIVSQTVAAIIHAERPNGTTDNPQWEDIKSKVIMTIKSGRRDLNLNLQRLKKKLYRLDQLAKRFKSKSSSDPVGDAFSYHRENLMKEIHQLEDALEMNVEMEKVFNSYDYEVEPGPEGHGRPSSTLRLGGEAREWIIP